MGPLSDRKSVKACNDFQSPNIKLFMSITVVTYNFHTYTLQLTYMILINVTGLQCGSVNKCRHGNKSRPLFMASSDCVPFGPAFINCSRLLQLFDVLPTIIGAGKVGVVRKVAQMLLLFTNL